MPGTPLRLLPSTPGISFSISREQDRKIINSRTRFVRAGLFLKVALILPPVIYTFWVISTIITAPYMRILEILLPNFTILKLRRSTTNETQRILCSRNLSQGKRKEKNRNQTQVNRRAQKCLA